MGYWARERWRERNEGERRTAGTDHITPDAPVSILEGGSTAEANDSSLGGAVST